MSAFAFYRPEAAIPLSASSGHGGFAPMVAIQ
jgi:hypothetical protein